MQELKKIFFQILAFMNTYRLDDHYFDDLGRLLELKIVSRLQKDSWAENITIVNDEIRHGQAIHAHVIGVSRWIYNLHVLR